MCIAEISLGGREEKPHPQPPSPWLTCCERDDWCGEGSSSCRNADESGEIGIMDRMKITESDLREDGIGIPEDSGNIPNSGRAAARW
jgi:hypothetical protein